MKKETYDFKNFLVKGDFKNLFKCFNKGWLNKLKTSNNISNSKLNKIILMAKKKGAEAAKISGAGGGGFIIFFSKPENKYNLQKFLSLQRGIIFNTTLTFDGVQSWKM